MNPIPDEVTEPACIVSEVRRARDACILLAGHRPYRSTISISRVFDVAMTLRLPVGSFRFRG